MYAFLIHRLLADIIKFIRW